MPLKLVHGSSSLSWILFFFFSSLTSCCNSSSSRLSLGHRSTFSLGHFSASSFIWLSLGRSSNSSLGHLFSGAVPPVTESLQDVVEGRGEEVMAGELLRPACLLVVVVAASFFTLLEGERVADQCLVVCLLESLPHYLVCLPRCLHGLLWLEHPLACLACPPGVLACILELLALL
jgi:hypothetical protein